MTCQPRLAPHAATRSRPRATLPLAFVALGVVSPTRSSQAQVAVPASSEDSGVAGAAATSSASPHSTANAATTSAESPRPARSDLGEPAVEPICRAAVAQALAEPERAVGFIKRARLAGWLPEVHFRAYRRFARTEGLTFADMTTGAIAPVDINAVDDVRYEWRASWDLSRIVFNPDELQAHFEALRMADVRRDIQTLVIKLYFERRRLMSGAERASATETTATLEKKLLRVAEIEAELDAMSGGAFSNGRVGQRQAARAP